LRRSSSQARRRRSERRSGNIRERWHRGLAGPLRERTPAEVQAPETDPATLTLKPSSSTAGLAATAASRFELKERMFAHGRRRREHWSCVSLEPLFARADPVAELLGRARRVGWIRDATWEVPIGGRDPLEEAPGARRPGGSTHGRQAPART
jgi:hypothetical protein